MTSPGFIHLHIHSAYSLLEGALAIGKVLDLAKADKQPALGIADTNNLFGALEFSDKAAGKGIQPIIGVELAVDFSEIENDQDRMQDRGHSRDRFGKGGLVLIAATSDGFANLSSLVSRAHLEGENGRAAARLGWLTPSEFARTAAPMQAMAIGAAYTEGSAPMAIASHAHKGNHEAETLLETGS